jgi:hypothetical protein
LVQRRAPRFELRLHLGQLLAQGLRMFAEGLRRSQRRRARPGEFLLALDQFGGFCNALVALCLGRSALLLDRLHAPCEIGK